MNNIPMLAKDLKKEIEDFLTTECGGEDVNEEEEKMYQELKLAVGYIDDFLSTQQMQNRKFEVGKLYYDKCYKLYRVEKITDKSVWFKGAYGSVRRETDYPEKNEYVHGTYRIKA